MVAIEPLKAPATRLGTRLPRFPRPRMRQTLGMRPDTWRQESMVDRMTVEERKSILTYSENWRTI